LSKKPGEFANLSGLTGNGLALQLRWRGRTDGAFSCAQDFVFDVTAYLTVYCAGTLEICESDYCSA